MNINAGDQRPNRGSNFLRDTFDTWYRKVQYEPWFIKISTVNHKILLALSILILLIIAICILRPQGQKIPQQKISSSRSILFLVDISKSMNVEDMNEQSRLNYSKWWAKKLMEDVPGDRYGLETTDPTRWYPAIPQDLRLTAGQ